MYKPTTEELDFMIRIMEEDKPEMVRTLSKEAQAWLTAVLRLANAVLRASAGGEVVVQ